MSIFDPVTKTLLRRAAPPPERRHRRLVSQNRGGAWLRGKPEKADRNPVAYRCARMIAEAVAAIPLKLSSDDETGQATVQLLRRPNTGQSGIAFLDALLMQLLSSGEVFIERVGEGDDGPRQLYLLNAQNMHVVSDGQGWPLYYEYHAAGKKRRHDANQLPCAIIHIRLGDDMASGKISAPFEVAALAIAIHDAANQWNKSLFQNAARPSGALVYRGQDGNARLTDAQFERLKQELQENFQGAENAGRPLLLEGGLDWARISMSPQDMDFIAAKHSAARDIALAFGVPPMLLGIPGDNSYANYAEANRAFWRQTVVPLALFEDTGWAFMSPQAGWLVWVAAEAKLLVFDGTAWRAAMTDNSAVPLFTSEQAVFEPARNVGLLEIPSHVTLLGVTAKIVQTVTGPAHWQLGTQNGADRFGFGLPLDQGSEIVGPSDPPQVYWQAETIKLTPQNGDFTGGRIAVAIHYIRLPLPIISSTRS